jgi:hypothetical protein
MKLYKHNKNKDGYRWVCKSNELISVHGTKRLQLLIQKQAEIRTQKNAVNKSSAPAKAVRQL